MGTYTTNYNLFMPTVGEQGWGELVNTNFSTIDTTMKSLSNNITSLDSRLDTVETYGSRITAIENEVNGALSCTSVATSGAITSTGKITANGGIGTTSLTTSSNITSTGRITANGGLTLPLSTSGLITVVSTEVKKEESGSASGGKTTPTFSFSSYNNGTIRYSGNYTVNVYGRTQNGYNGTVTVYVAGTAKNTYTTTAKEYAHLGTISVPVGSSVYATIVSSGLAYIKLNITAKV